MKETDPVKARHKKGIIGIIQSYGLSNIIWSFPSITSLLLSILVVGFLYFNQQYNSHDILIKLSDLSLLIYPSLLGFSLGGYALIIGFGNTSLLKSMTRTKTDKDFTIFQRMNGIFAFGLLLQVLELIFAFIIKFTNILEGSNRISFFLTHPNISQILNLGGNFLLLWWACWSLIMIPFIVSNVFLFGQMHHLYLTKQRMIEDRQKEAEKQKEPKA